MMEFKPSRYLVVRPERGVTLIMVAAVLAILSALATGFYTMMLMQTKSALRYSDSVRADMMARGGIDFAVAHLHDQAFKKTEDPTDPWYMVDYLRGAKRSVSYADGPLLHNGLDNDGDGIVDNREEVKGDLNHCGFSSALGATCGYDDPTDITTGSDRFTLNIFDSGSRININACDNLGVLLDNLCRVVGPPLMPADQRFLVPRVWEWYGGVKYNTDANDWPKSGTAGAGYGDVARDIYYNTYDQTNVIIPWFAAGRVNPNSGRPAINPVNAKSALFGDGYAIAGYRARKGKFKSLEEVKAALTYVERSSPPNNLPDDPLEQLEIEVKFSAIRDYITINSWVDTTTVCTGKFEWIPQLASGGGTGAQYEMAIDRDKSWIPDDPNGDPENKRGSLRGCYVAIVNGHGAGQVRRIRTNGIDWIQVETFQPAAGGPAAGAITGFSIPPGPASAYMIYSREDAKLEDVGGSPVNNVSYNGTEANPPKPPGGLPAGTDPTTGKPLTVVGYFPRMKTTGQAQYLDDDEYTDYSARPLCIHRAPININTASDKVLAAMFLGINVTHGHFLSVATDADLAVLAKYDAVTGKLKSRYSWNPADPDWKIGDFDNPGAIYRTVEPFIMTPKGMKRIPGSPGFLKYDVDYVATLKPLLAACNYDMDYLGNYGLADPAGSNKISDAHELAFRILISRQYDAAYKFINPLTGAPTAAGKDAYKRGPFTNWDDLYFRVVKPWDDARQLNSIDGAGIQHKASVARVVMAHANPNTDILKFNPNIEWIDRWGRNFTETEPIMVYTNQQETADGISLGGHGKINGALATPGDITTCDLEGFMNPDAVPVFNRERIGWTGGGGPFFVCGIFGTEPKWMGSYVTRGFRFKSDEMIDKTDLNRSTTEFSFNSGGVYEIQSIGQVMKRGELLAERKVQALIKIYDVWRESTQQQFVNGYMTPAAGLPGTAQSGTIARDFKNVNSRLSLNTLPEPLVPLRYTIQDPISFAINTENKEVVDVDIGATNNKRNAWGQPVDINMPGVLASKVLPASWDGQIVLATNTQRFDPTDAGDADTFLASFNGDIDTATCNGNGHEQAKTPIDHKIPVLDSISLLGALNDTQMDADPGLFGDSSGTTAVKPDLPAPWGSSPYSTASQPLDIYRYQSVRNALRGMRPDFYWNNVTCRQGDLRNDGLYVSGPGVAGNDGVMKFLCGADDPANYDRQNFSLNGRGAQRVTGEGAKGSPGTVEGWLLSMWTKTTWHHNDNRSHEFFDCSTPGWNDGGIRSEAFWLRKQGGPQFAVCEAGSLSSLSVYEDGTWGVSGAGNRVNDLSLIGEYNQNAGDWSDPDWTTYLHGGTSGVPNTRTDPVLNPGTYRPESPAYRVQPFRWQFIGARVYLSQDLSKSTNAAPAVGWPGGVGGAGKSGFWKSNQLSEGWKDNNALWMTQNLFRPFIDSERFPEGPDYSPYAKYWGVHQTQGSTGFVAYQDKGRIGPIAGRGDGGQSARWRWASPGGDAAADGGQIINHQIFGLNNCNPGRGYNGSGNQFASIYRGTPEEGTFAVIDEYKISRKDTVLKNPWVARSPSSVDWGDKRPEYDNDRIARDNLSKPGEMTLSRYYLPEDPSRRDNCPSYTSQTMLQSMKGYDKFGAGVPEEKVTLARVSWSVFTPRFLHENKRAGGKFSRVETITKSTAGAPSFMPVHFRGPFDYCKYNDLKDEKYEDFNAFTYDNDVTVVPFRSNRPTPADYQNPALSSGAADYKLDNSYHTSLGVEVALLEDKTEDPTNSAALILGNGGKPFSNPNQLNKILSASNESIRVATKHLRYRVYFRYPADQMADTTSGIADQDRKHMSVDPASMYLLDSPVFDDISVTYFTKPRILDYRDVME